MELSQRAKSFLAKQKRRPHISDRNVILLALVKANFPIFESVISFQQNYG